MPYFPEWSGTLAQWVVAVFAICGPFFFLSEAHGGLAFGYSKFANRQAKFTLPSRLGMFIIYFPAVLLFPAVLWGLGVETTPWHLLTAGMISVHFGKRCLETLFVHKYSGVMNGFSVAMICGLYSTQSALLGYIAATEMPKDLVLSSQFQPMFGLGLALWVAGTAINAWHHIILANLRQPGETGYKVPRGGLFRWIACPHYLGELVAWWGFSLVFHHIAAFVVTATMTFYLAGRAFNTVKWYRSKGIEVPDTWKRLVPFVY
jgi:very-long-chain enoyl-CoA reductase